jgi:hypothetical protein
MTGGSHLFLDIQHCPVPGDVKHKASALFASRLTLPFRGPNIRILITRFSLAVLPNFCAVADIALCGNHEIRNVVHSVHCLHAQSQDRSASPANKLSDKRVRRISLTFTFASNNLCRSPVLSSTVYEFGPFLHHAERRSFARGRHRSYQERMHVSGTCWSS